LTKFSRNPADENGIVPVWKVPVSVSSGSLMAAGERQKRTVSIDERSAWKSDMA
jgi:hypothetical protein